MKTALLFFFSAITMGSACSPGPEGRPGCVDLDGDGFGIGRECEGEDCNDLVVDVQVQPECEDWCGEHPTSPGCVCDGELGVEPKPCHVGTLATWGVGACTSGLTRCENGEWSACEGAVAPTDEICDDVDNDCNGRADDGSLTECGACDCERDCSGPDCGGWGDGTTVGLDESSEGWLTLDGTYTALHVVWPVSSETGLVMRVNTRTYAIEAAFWSGPTRVTPGSAQIGDEPRRVAIDAWGDALILNRAIASRSSVTRIAREPASCPDRNDDGQVGTSTGWEDVLAFDGPDDWDDECILWHTIVGGVGALAQALASGWVGELDGDGGERVWVGLATEARFVELDGDTGEPTGVEVPTDDCMPNDAAIDQDGWLWVACSDSSVRRFDTAAPETPEVVSRFDGGGIYVVVDEHNAPWFIRGFEAFRWSRDAQSYQRVLFELVFGGIGNLASDHAGSIWAAADNGSVLYRISNADRAVFPQPTEAPTSSVAVDFDGQVWAVNEGTGEGLVLDIEGVNERPMLDTCDAADCLTFPRLYGDPTGRQRQTDFLVKSGTWRKVVDGCPGETVDWKRLSVDAAVEEGASVGVRARTAPTEQGLASASWVPLGTADAAGTTFELGDALPEGQRFLEIDVELTGNVGAFPTLRRLEVLFGCLPGGVAQ